MNVGTTEEVIEGSYIKSTTEFGLFQGKCVQFGSQEAQACFKMVIWRFQRRWSQCVLDVIRVIAILIERGSKIGINEASKQAHGIDAI